MDMEMSDDLRKLVRLMTRPDRIIRLHSLLSPKSQAHVSTILGMSVLEGEYFPEFAVIDILEQVPSDEQEKMLEASAFISERVSLNSNLHYWLISSMMGTRKFAPALEALYSAAPEEQGIIISVAEAVSLMDKEDDKNPQPIHLKATSEGPIKLADEKLVDAFFNYHDYAPVIAKHYIARGSLEGLDELLTAPKAVSGGVL